MLSRRVRLRKYCCQVRRYVLGSLPAVVVVHPGGGSAAAYLRWGCRVRRCVSTQFGQRVWPLIAWFGQSLQRPSSLRRCRSSVASTRLSSRFSSSVSRDMVGFAVGLRLAEAARVSLRGLVDSRFWDVCCLSQPAWRRRRWTRRYPPLHVCAGRMTVGSVVRVVSGGHSPRSWRSWFSSSRTRASASSNVGMCSPVLGSYQPSWPSVQRRLRLRMVL